MQATACTEHFSVLTAAPGCLWSTAVTAGQHSSVWSSAGQLRAQTHAACHVLLARPVAMAQLFVFNLQQGAGELGQLGLSSSFVGGTRRLRARAPCGRSPMHIPCPPACPHGLPS